MLKILPALRTLLFALVALSPSVLAGCGLKGDLVLPDSTEPARETDSEREEETGTEGQTDRRGSTDGPS